MVGRFSLADPGPVVPAATQATNNASETEISRVLLGLPNPRVRFASFELNYRIRFHCKTPPAGINFPLILETIQMKINSLTQSGKRLIGRRVGPGFFRGVVLR